MKSPLASLVLLLFTLCRSSQGDQLADALAHGEALLKKISELQDFVPAAQKPGIEAKLEYVDLFVATAMSIPSLAVPDDKIIAAIKNGVKCAFSKANFEADFKKAFYGTVDRNDAKEDPVALELGVKCEATAPTTLPPNYDCYCNKKNLIVFCAAQTFIDGYTVTPTTCPDAALTELKGAGHKEFGKIFDYKTLKDTPEKDSIKDLFSGKDGSVEKFVKPSDVNQLKIFCDAVEKPVEDAVKKLMASSGAYALVESFTALKTLDSDSDALAFVAACKAKDADLMASVFGECVCEGTRGFSFCVYKAIGKELVKEEALKCDAVPTIDTKKVPSKTEIAPKKKEGGDGGASNSTASPAPASAAPTTTFGLSLLMLTPLAALLV